MRAVGLLLLVVILVVGYRALTSSPSVIVVSGAPPQATTPSSAPPANPALTAAVDSSNAPGNAAPSMDGCFAPAHDYNASIPDAIIVPPGHLLVASFFRPGQPEQATVLTPGTWRNDAGWTFGVTFDYPRCPQDRVEREAAAHAGRRGGAYLGVDQGFSLS
jgi:hypothetical protein